MGECSGAVAEGRLVTECRLERRPPWLGLDKLAAAPVVLGRRDGVAPSGIAASSPERAAEPDAERAAGVAHDLCNLLMLILGHAEIAKCDVSEGSPLFHALEEIIRAADAGAALSGQLLHSKAPQLAAQRPACLNRAVQSMLSIAQPSLPPRVAVDTRLTPGLWLAHANESALGQVVMNLLRNAWEAMPGGGTLTIATENVCVGRAGNAGDGGMRPGEWVCLTVADTGVGMSDDTARRIFEPYFTSKPSGTGLGLPIVQGIVSHHGGWVAVESELGRGSVFRVFFPACAPEPLKIPSA